MVFPAIRVSVGHPSRVYLATMAYGLCFSRLTSSRIARHSRWSEPIRSMFPLLLVCFHLCQVRAIPLLFAQIVFRMPIRAPRYRPPRLPQPGFVPYLLAAARSLPKGFPHPSLLIPKVASLSRSFRGILSSSHGSLLVFLFGHKSIVCSVGFFIPLGVSLVLPRRDFFS
jgi:hypothetical protein